MFKDFCQKVITIISLGRLVETAISRTLELSAGLRYVYQCQSLFSIGIEHLTSTTIRLVRPYVTYS
jgi:hypothetical protein